MSAELVTDMKMALVSVDEIIKESSDNKSVLTACQTVVDGIKEGMKIYPEETTRLPLEVTELFGLYRTRITLMLLRDVNRFGENKPEVERDFTMILEIVEGKISTLKEGKENKNEKDIRR